jgi:hypothetical protein
MLIVNFNDYFLFFAFFALAHHILNSINWPSSYLKLTHSWGTALDTKNTNGILKWRLGFNEIKSMIQNVRFLTPLYVTWFYGNVPHLAKIIL